MSTSSKCVDGVPEFDIYQFKKGTSFSFFLDVKLKDGTSMAQSFNSYDFVKAKKTYNAMRKHKDVSFIQLGQVFYLFEEEGEEDVTNE